MRKWLSILLVLLLMTPVAAALGSDYPFQAGVNYTEPYADYGAATSMLNFGRASSLCPGESFYDVKTTTIKKIKATQLKKYMDSCDFYCYAKWQCDKSIDECTIDAMLVMTTPDGTYYATYGSWDIYDQKRRTMYSWFFDVTRCLERYLDENGGSFDTGTYTFSLFFNDQVFRTSKVTVT